MRTLQSQDQHQGSGAGATVLLSDVPPAGLRAAKMAEASSCGIAGTRSCHRKGSRFPQSRDLEPVAGGRPYSPNSTAAAAAPQTPATYTFARGQAVAGNYSTGNRERAKMLTGR
jgi:hypothetical protein